MRHLFCIALFCFLMSGWNGETLFADGNTPHHLYVQLIRGNNDASPPSKDSKPVGPKLSARLHPVFAWKHYWEVSRKEVKISKGSVKTRLSKEREVEIDIGDSGKRLVTVYFNGKKVMQHEDNNHATMTILGGDRGDKTAWLIVVRTDKPTIE